MHDQETGRTTAADADLVLRTRSGDAEAFGELWRRHYSSGIAVARSITSSIDPDDLVQESFARIYQAILKGGGPNGSFRAYLFTSIRNTAAAWGRSRRETAIDEMEAVADPESTDAAANEALDRGLTAQAFRSLPSRWQEVLWYSEIEQMKPAEIAPLLGMKAGAVSQLAFRAREGLREAWIQAHLRSVADGSDCQWTIERLGAYSRGNLGSRDHARVEKHLDSCARCMIVAAEAQDVSNRLALVLLPLVLGITGAAGYLATLQGGGTPIVALAAMPSSVVEGAVVVSGTAGTASAGVAGATAGSASGSSGGGFGGVGALVGAGSAALVVAGVVAAAAVVPGMLHTAPATSQPSASESDSSVIATEVQPDSSMVADEPVVVEIADEVPQEPEAPPVDEAPPPAPPAETSAPVPAVDPGVTDPGEETDPGTEPGTAPGTDPGTDPGDPEPEPEPTPPEGTPTLGDATAYYSISDRSVVYVVPVTGDADSTVRTTMGDATQDVLLDAAGAAAFELLPTWQQVCDDATVSYSYIEGDLQGEIVTTTLSQMSGFTPPPGLCDLTHGPGDATDEETTTGETALEVPGPVEQSDPLSPTEEATSEAPYSPETTLDTPEETTSEPATSTASAGLLGAASEDAIAAG